MTSADPVVAADRSVDAWLAEHTEGLIAIRRNIHAHPELSGEEYATTELVAERLTLAGLTPRRFEMGTGLACDVGPIDSGQPVLAVRADLDALAMDDEKHHVPYRSQVPGAAHACGHDVHTTIALGAALYFSHHPDELPGPLRFLFQPAEERVPGGAKGVIADGGIDGVDAIVGLHCEPKLDVGVIGVKSGPVSSAADMVHISLSGPGGHTARPELTVDLFTVAALLISELPDRVATALHETFGDGEVKIVFGSVHGGDAANVIPTHCELQASVRAPNLAVWESLPAIVERTVSEILAPTGAGYEVDYTHGVPPVVNDDHITDLVRLAATNEFGPDAVVGVEQSWGGDDFAWFTREIPGSYVRLGVHDTTEAAPRLDLHIGHFDVDERSIALGVRLLIATAREFFDAGPAAR